MRCGQINTARWFKICPKMVRSYSLRLGLMLVIGLFFIFTYMLFTSRQRPVVPPKVAPPVVSAEAAAASKMLYLRTSQLGQHGKDISENIREKNLDYRSNEPETKPVIKPMGVQQAAGLGGGGDEFHFFMDTKEEHESKSSRGVNDNMADDTSGARRAEPHGLNMDKSAGGDSVLPKVDSKQGTTGTNQTGGRPHGVVPVPCDVREQVSEILRLPPIKFLPDFKNPCWIERITKPLEEIYANNGFAKYSSSYEKAFDKIKDDLLAQDARPQYRLRCLPYFLLAGQPKCGSTDLYKRIVSHPDVVTPPTKESHWWGKNRYGWCLNFTATIPFSDYVDLYDGAALEIESVVDGVAENGQAYHPLITGDASVSTLWANDEWWMNPENCGRLEPTFTNAHHVHLILPNTRIIVILRNPTDRLYSDFLYFQRFGKSQEYFHNEVQAAINSVNKCILDVGMRACVYNYTMASKSRVRLRLGLYQVFLQEWLSLFPREQVLVLRLEDYSVDPLATIKLVHKFLDLRTLSVEEEADMLGQPMWNTRRESDRKLGKMLAKTRALLDDFYRPYNEKLAKLLGDDRFLWRK